LLEFLNFFLLFLVNLLLLVEPFLCLFPFGIVLLQKLTEIDQMDLDFKVTLPDILLNAFESLLLFFELLFLDLKGLMHFIHFPTFFQQLGGWGNCFELDMRGDLLDLLSLFLHGVQFRLA
jgi:hypothetical protein